MRKSKYLSSKFGKRTVCLDFKTTWLAISRFYNLEANKEEITTNIGFVLLHIDEEKGTPATKIAPLMGMEPRSLSRMLARLEERKLVYRQADPHDRRMVRIFLTEEGKHKRKSSRNVVIDFNKSLAQNIDPEKLDIFSEVVDQIHQIVKEKQHAGS